METRAKIFSRIEEISAEKWNNLALNSAPMLEFEYLYSLEKSGSISADKGYVPAHIALYDGSKIFAIAPLYQRDRATVEFGDGGLIEFLTELTGLPFGYGLVGSIPYTPIPGYDFLVDSSRDVPRIHADLLDKIDDIANDRGFSTTRLYFVAPDSRLHSILAEHGYIRLSSAHPLWFNRGYRTFDDFLGSFASSRRTKIKRERRSIGNSGIHIEMVQGQSAPLSFYQELYMLYRRTWTKHMGPGIRPLLSESFFMLLGRNFSHRCSFSVSQISGKRIAMALFYNKAQTLYGRYWGCFREIPFLHFDTCYYSPIDYAIENGVRMIDPGFGGEHKTIRGFENTDAYHYLKFYDENQRRIAYAVLDQMSSQLTSK